MWKKIKSYVVSIAVSLAVGGAGALATKDNMNLYSEIREPPLNPPPAVFPVVWTVLFALMGISAAMVYKYKDEKKEEVKKCLWVYAASLVVNFAWCILFFNLRLYFASFLWILFLWALILAMVLLFRKVDEKAGNLQIPYLLWVTFAAYLNLAIFILN